MPFPNTPLPLRVKIAPGANPATAPSTWPSWVDITNLVRVEQGVQISDGRANEGALVDASSMSLTLDDRVGDFNPVNPNGAYYPLLRRNCPIRVGVDVCSDAFTRSSASGWGFVTTPATTAPIQWTHNFTVSDFTVTGTQGQCAIVTNSFRTGLVLGGEAADTEGRCTFVVPAVALGASMSVGGLARYQVGSPNAGFYFFELSLDVGGTCKAVIGKSALNTGSFTNLALTGSLGSYSAGQSWTVAWQAVGNTLAMKAWPTASAEPAGWQLGYTDITALPGTRNGVAMWRQNGNTNATTLNFLVDDYRLEDIEYAGNIVEFPVTWNQAGNDAIAQLKAAGPFRRLQQGQTPVKSPLGRQLASAAVSGPVLGLWMMEDDSGSLTGSTQSTGSSVATALDVSFGASADLPGSLQQAKLNSAISSLRMSTSQRVANALPNGLNVTTFYRLAAVPPIAGAGLWTIGATGPITSWTLSVNNASFTLVGYDGSGTAVATPAATSYPAGFDVTKWFAVTFYANNIAGTVSYNVYYHQVGTGNGFGSGPGGTFATASVTSASSVAITGSATMAGAFIGPIRIGDNSFPFLAQSFRNVASGWFGELAGDRINRLCLESGVASAVESATTEPMGIQRVNPLFSLLRECEAADFGTLYEAGWGVAYRPRALRYARTPVLVLDRSSGHLADPPTPTLDDQRLINDVTLSRDGGAQNVRYFDQTSVTNEGTYDTSLSINTSTDDVLPNQAAWRVYLGITQELRWPDLSLDLMRNTSLIAAWRSRVFGDRMTVANELLQVAGSPPDVIIEGTSVTLSAFEWTAQANCSPARPWDMATLDDANLRLDTVGSTIATAPSPAATGTSMTVATTSGPLWVTTAANPAEFPFPISVAGEIMTVTAIVGTTSPQAFTVTRNVNALPGGKAQVVGASVALQRPMILAL